jgi:acyl-CoA thioesterase-1
MSPKPTQSLLLRFVITLLLAAGVSCDPDRESTTSLPHVLIIGDSISIYYTEPLRERLKGRAIVERNPGNAEHSGHGLAHLDAWLGDKEWAVIHFNHGLHDLKYVDQDGNNVIAEGAGHIQVPLDQYERNLEAIVLRLKGTGARLIFATTTPYPDRLTGPIRLANLAEQYNAVALEIMEKHAVVVNDLYAFALPRLPEIQTPNDVHFTPEGSRILAEEVAKHIIEVLKPPGE